MVHAAIAALDTRPLDVRWNLFDLSRNLAEVMESRPLAHGSHMNHAFLQGLCILCNILALPKDDACQQRHDGEKTVQGVQIDFAHHTSE